MADDPKSLGARLSKAARDLSMPRFELPPIHQPRIDPSVFEEIGNQVAAEKRAAVEREEAILGEMRGMRESVEAAEGRAEAAEGREREALDLARRNYRVAVIAAIVAALSLAATVLVAALA